MADIKQLKDLYNQIGSGGLTADKNTPAGITKTSPTTDFQTFHNAIGYASNQREKEALEKQKKIDAYLKETQLDKVAKFSNQSLTATKEGGVSNEPVLDTSLGKAGVSKLNRQREEMGLNTYITPVTMKNGTKFDWKRTISPLRPVREFIRNEIGGDFARFLVGKDEGYWSGLKEVDYSKIDQDQNFFLKFIDEIQTSVENRGIIRGFLFPSLFKSQAVKDQENIKNLNSTDWGLVDKQFRSLGYTRENAERYVDIWNNGDRSTLPPEVKNQLRVNSGFNSFFSLLDIGSIISGGSLGKLLKVSDVAKTGKQIFSEGVVKEAFSHNNFKDIREVLVKASPQLKNSKELDEFISTALRISDDQKLAKEFQRLSDDLANNIKQTIQATTKATRWEATKNFFQNKDLNNAIQTGVTNDLVVKGNKANIPINKARPDTEALRPFYNDTGKLNIQNSGKASLKEGLDFNQEMRTVLSGGREEMRLSNPNVLASEIRGGSLPLDTTANSTVTIFGLKRGNSIRPMAGDRLSFSEKAVKSIADTRSMKNIASFQTKARNLVRLEDGTFFYAPENKLGQMQTTVRGLGTNGKKIKEIEASIARSQEKIAKARQINHEKNLARNEAERQARINYHENARAKVNTELREAKAIIAQGDATAIAEVTKRMAHNNRALTTAIREDIRGATNEYKVTIDNLTKLAGNASKKGVIKKNTEKVVKIKNKVKADLKKIDTKKAVTKLKEEANKKIEAIRKYKTKTTKEKAKAITKIRKERDKAIAKVTKDNKKTRGQIVKQTRKDITTLEKQIVTDKKTVRDLEKVAKEQKVKIDELAERRDFFTALGKKQKAEFDKLAKTKKAEAKEVVKELEGNPYLKERGANKELVETMKVVKNTLTDNIKSGVIKVSDLATEREQVIVNVTKEVATKLKNVTTATDTVFGKAPVKEVTKTKTVIEKVAEQKAPEIKVIEKEVVKEVEKIIERTEKGAVDILPIDNEGASVFNKRMKARKERTERLVESLDDDGKSLASLDDYHLAITNNTSLKTASDLVAKNPLGVYEDVMAGHIPKDTPLVLLIDVLLEHPYIYNDPVRVSALLKKQTPMLTRFAQELQASSIIAKSDPMYAVRQLQQRGVKLMEQELKKNNKVDTNLIAKKIASELDTALKEMKAGTFDREAFDKLLTKITCSI